MTLCLTSIEKRTAQGREFPRSTRPGTAGATNQFAIVLPQAAIRVGADPHIGAGCRLRSQQVGVPSGHANGAPSDRPMPRQSSDGP
jgi:hypothetical protein